MAGKSPDWSGLRKDRRRGNGGDTCKQHHGAALTSSYVRKAQNNKNGRHMLKGLTSGHILSCP